MKAFTLECAAFCLILGLGACADSLAGAKGGMAVLMGGVALSGALVRLAHSRAWDRERDPAEATEAPRSATAILLLYERKKPSEGKRKAAAVITTPQRQVKQSAQAIISRPYFTGVKGDCQIEF